MLSQWKKEFADPAREDVFLILFPVVLYTFFPF